MNVLTISDSLVNSNLVLKRPALNNFQFTLIGSKILFVQFFPTVFSNTLMPFINTINENTHSLDHEYARANSSLMHKVKILALCMFLISQNLSNLQLPLLEARACFKFTQNQAMFLSAYTSLFLSIPQEIRWITVWLKKTKSPYKDLQRFLNAYYFC